MPLILFRNEHMIKSLNNYVNRIRTPKMASFVSKKFISWKKMTLDIRHPLYRSIFHHHHHRHQDRIKLVKVYQEVKDYFPVDYINKIYRQMKNINTHMHRLRARKSQTMFIFSPFLQPFSFTNKSQN